MTERLVKFLGVVETARFRDVPAVWYAELSEALGDGLVKIGWGGVVELTDDGRKVVQQAKGAE